MAISKRLNRQDEEPTYVPDGAEFDTEDTSWAYPDDLENQEVIQKAFHICGHRKYFKTQKEASLWRRIDGQISRGMIPEGWIKEMLDWARTKNKNVVAIRVYELGKAIMNKPAMQDWMGEHKDSLRKPEDY